MQLSTYFLKYFRDRGQFGGPLCSLLSQGLDVFGLEHRGKLNLSVFKLLDLGLGVVNVEESAAAMLFICAKGECLFAPFLLHLVELLLELQLTASRVEDVLDGRSMATSRGKKELHDDDLGYIYSQQEAGVQYVSHLEDAPFQLEGAVGHVHHLEPMAVADLLGVELL